MARKLSKKEKGFVKDYIETGNATEAAARNYDVKSREVARAIGSENLTKPHIIKTLAERIPDDLLEQKHLELLNKADQEGNIDAQAVAKGLDMAYKLKGAYAPDKSVNVNLEAKLDDPMIQKLAEALNSKLKEDLTS